MTLRDIACRDPLPLTLLRAWTKVFGTLRQRERLGLVHRSPYAYGLLRAATTARFFGVSEVTACEFGVAAGAGLANLVELATQITHATDVRFRMFGFDTGAGLPALTGYRDHPEIWSPGDFPMLDRDQLLTRLAGRATMVFGDIAESVPAFVATLDPAAPLGFVSVDVDMYSSTRSALGTLMGRPAQYLPAVSMYFDDVAFYFANAWCGELAAINEFNAAGNLRKIDPDRSLDDRLLRRPWYRQMYVYHVLDHPDRSAPRRRTGETIAEHAARLTAFD